MSSVGRIRRDPAPSRLRYRLDRLWLTPAFRFLLRVGLPMAVTFTVGMWAMNKPEFRQSLEEQYFAIRNSIESRPEFEVKLMAIDGASEAISEDIREIVPVDFPVSSFDLDLEGMQARIGELDAVQSVSIHIRTGGILQIDVVERVPAAVWRYEDSLELLDREGHRVAVIGSRLERPDLPLFAGRGAADFVPEALALVAAASPVGERLRGLVRIGERRWDVVLDRGQRILLPEKNPVPALEQVMAMENARDLLERDVTIVDMRIPQRPTLRLGEPALDELQQIRGLAQEESE